jgi:hypothetical protein
MMPTYQGAVIGGLGDNLASSIYNGFYGRISFVARD